MIRKKQLIFGVLACLICTVNALGQSSNQALQEADIFYQSNNYSRAQEKYVNALNLSESKKKLENVCKASFGIARCHYSLRDKEMALSWLYRSLAIAEENELDSLLPEIHYFMSVMFIETGVVDSAEFYSAQAINVWQKQRQYDRISTALAALSDLYLNTTLDINQAEKTILQAKYYAKRSDCKNCAAFVAMKEYFLDALLRKDYKAALTHINEAEKLYLQLNDREGIAYAYSFKAECLAKLGDTTAADYFWKWFEFKDSIFQAEKTANLAKYETLYETNKKEQENKALRHENELNRLILFIAVSLLLLLLILVLWFYNRSKLKLKEDELVMLQKLQHDKERIARDLHDNVGGQLSYIIYSLEGITNEDKEKRFVITEMITQTVRNIITSLRETIWAISDANIQAQDFSDKFKVFAKTLFKHSATQINYTENIETNRELNSLLGLNLYRICQEILNNTLKHANASAIIIDLQCNVDEFKLTISDNGVGFNPTQLNNGHYGLQNIKKRAEEFGISLTLETEINKGTKYTLIV